MDHFLRIGEFAKLGRVSVKALRFYETKGLLIPEYVDPSSGYRYYNIEQCNRLALILNLRAAKFSIKEIAAVIELGSDSQHVLQLVNEQRRRLLNERADIDGKLRVLDTLSKSLVTDVEHPLSVVKLDSVSAQRVHSVVATVPHLGDPVTEIFEAAESVVSKFNARSPTAPFLIFHDPPSVQNNISLEICIPLKDECASKLDSVVVEGCDLACCVVYAGSYAHTDPLRTTITKWADDVGLFVAGPLREVYHRFGADQIDYELPAALTTTKTEQFVTELQIPISTI